MERGPQFAYDYKAFSSGGHHVRITATHRESGQEVGFLVYDKKMGRVSMVHTDINHRRKGVATGMWRHAQEVAQQGLSAEPRHSAVRTAEGDAWVKSLGEEAPPRAYPSEFGNFQ